MSYVLKGKLESVKYDSAGKVEEIKIVPCGEYTLRQDDKKYCVIMQSVSREKAATHAELLEYENAVTILIIGKCGLPVCRRILMVTSGLGNVALFSFSKIIKTKKEDKQISIKSDQQRAGKELIFATLESIEIFA